MTTDGSFGFPLVDLMSNSPPADIGTGEMEMILLADEIADAVRGAFTTRPRSACAHENAVEAILRDLRGRKLLKLLFSADADTNTAPIGHVEGPLDLATQRECASAWVDLVVSALSTPATLDNTADWEEETYTRWVAGDETLPTLPLDQHTRFQERLNRRYAGYVGVEAVSGLAKSNVGGGHSVVPLDNAAGEKKS